MKFFKIWLYSAITMSIIAITLGRSEDVCLSVHRDDDDPEAIQGRPGKQGAVGPMGPSGPPGPQGSCQCNVTPLNSQIQMLTARLDRYIRALTCDFPADLGWVVYGSSGRCYQYKLTPSAQSWQASRQACQAEGGDLASEGIRLLPVQSEVTRNLLGNQLTWIGLHDTRSEGNFVWLNGDRLQSSEFRFGNGQPDNARNNEDCVELNWRRVVPIELNDRPCSYNNRGLCEKQIQI